MVLGMCDKFLDINIFVTILEAIEDIPTLRVYHRHTQMIFNPRSLRSDPNRMCLHCENQSTKNPIL